MMDQRQQRLIAVLFAFLAATGALGSVQSRRLTDYRRVRARGRGLLQVNQTPGVTPTFLDDVWPIIARYISADNHLITPGAGGLSMPNAPTAWVNMVNVQSQGLPEMDLIEPGDHDNSFFWQKITAGPQLVGLAMPPPSVGQLTEEEINTVTSWIDSGAVYAFDETTGDVIIPTSTSGIRGGNVVSVEDSIYLSVIGTVAVLIVVVLWKRAKNMTK